MAHLPIGGVVVAAAALLALPTTASADPWTGYYVGAFAGGAWGDGGLATDVGTLHSNSYFSSNENIASVEGNTSGSTHSKSFTGGVQLGANQRFDQLVVGAEVDFGAFNLNGTRGAAGIEYPTFATLSYTTNVAYSTDWLFTARGRFGWLASQSLLLYFTGGLAVSDVRVSNAFFDLPANTGIIFARGGSARTTTRAGYTLGAGFEAKLGGPWSIKAEYLYVDLGSTSTKGLIGATIVPNQSPFDTSVDVTANIARIGVNYSFGD